MELTRRKVGSVSIASLIGLGGCLSSSSSSTPFTKNLEFVDEKPDYVESITLSPTQAVVKFNQLDMSKQLEYAVLVSESAGQLGAGKIPSGISEVPFIFPDRIGETYDFDEGDTLYMLIMDGGEADCFNDMCTHSGGEIVERFELAVTDSS